MSADPLGPPELLALFTQAAKLLREAADDAMSKHGVRVGRGSERDVTIGTLVL